MSISDVVRQHVDRVVGEDPRAWAFCTVLSHDERTHTVTVRVEPEGTVFPGVQVSVPCEGWAVAPPSGMQGTVLLGHGVPKVLLGLQYSALTAVPEGGAVLTGDVHVSGGLTVTGPVVLAGHAALPDPTDDLENAVVTMDARPSYQADARPAATYQCLRGADGGLSWELLGHAP